MKDIIIFEDKHIIVCNKPVGVLSQSDRSFEVDLYSMIKTYLKGNYVAVIHRLDKPVGGIIVFAKNKSAAASLSRQIKEGEFKKKYLSLVKGKTDIKNRLEDYLLKEKRGNISKVVDKSIGKKAILEYSLEKQVFIDDEEFSLVDIELFTGRHHQIRLQFKNAGHPIYGDRKYSDFNKGNLALYSYYLGFKHPVSKKYIEFEIDKERILNEVFTYGGLAYREDC